MRGLGGLEVALLLFALRDWRVRAGGVRIQGLIDVKLNFKRLPAVMPRDAVKAWSTVSVVTSGVGVHFALITSPKEGW